MEDDSGPFDAAFQAVVSKHIPRVLGMMFHCSALLQTHSAWCSPLDVFSPFSSTISTAQIIFPSVYCGHPDVVTASISCMTPSMSDNALESQ